MEGERENGDAFTPTETKQRFQEEEEEAWAKKWEPLKPEECENKASTTTKTAAAGSAKTKYKSGIKTRTAMRNVSTDSKATSSLEDKEENRFVLEFDGASRGNPGIAGAGALIRDKGEIVKEICTSLGVATVNEAEYHGLLTGLKAAVDLGIKDIRVRGDSNLIVSQVKGDWKVKEPKLIPLHLEASELRQKFNAFDIVHVKREFNKDADALANSAIDDGTHMNDYAIDNNNSRGVNGGGGSGSAGGGARMLRKAQFMNISRASIAVRLARLVV